jgi:mono/diheme cytochrome c family protein
MRGKTKRGSIAITAGLLLLARVPLASESAVAPDAHFEKAVQPIIVGRCLECHAGDRKGGLDLRTAETLRAGGDSGAVVVPGEPDASLLYEYVSTQEMPPKSPLTADEIASIRTWIEQEAFFPDEPLDLFAATTDKRAGYDWWSLQPLADASPPDIAPAPEFEAWQRNPIDCFTYAKLDETGLTPSAPASPRVLIRRATYDLIGLPPTPEEVRAFIAACEAETGEPGIVGEAAYAALVDRLLASQHYGERWGRHWLDVVRFGESTGYEVNHILDDMWPYRDFVIQSFNEDKPYDLFVREQLAGDAIAPGDPSVEVGMTFLVAGPHDIVGNQDPVQAAQIRANTVDEMIRATSESFMGLTVGCARCHDHKFDPISQRDYYAMYATFAGVHHDSRTVATPDERAAYEEKVGPLRAERDRLTKERGALEDAIVARAEESIAELETRWSRPAVNRRGTEEVFPPVRAKFLRLRAEGRDNDPAASTDYRIDEFEVWTADELPRNVALASNGGKASGKSRVAEDFGDAYLPDLVIDGELGARWIASGPDLQIEFAQPETIRRVFFSSDRPGALSPDHGEAPMVCEYRIEVSMDGETWTHVADSYSREPVNDRHRRHRLLNWGITTEERERRAELGRQIAEAAAEIRRVPTLPSLRVGRLTQPESATQIFLGGDPQRPGDEVVPSSLDALQQTADYALNQSAAERERRAALADWLVAPSNPLTPRVLANRLWYYHFGRGLVPNPSDFGFMGGRPSHAALLDWLAKELAEPGNAEEAWRLKRMHKTIMLSQTYRQASTYRPEAANVDGANELLWRFTPRRLSAEELRDSMLAIAGKLDTTMGGPGFRLYQYMRDNVSTYAPLDEHGPETYRRAVYHQNVRASRIDLMTEFDSPDCAMSTPRRATTTTPLQALTLMNHQFTLDMADALAARVESESGESLNDQIDRAFQLAFGRSVTADELSEASAFAREHGMGALCRGLFNANELVYLD